MNNEGASIQYLAGFFDGEGTIGVYSQRRGISSLMRLQAAAGGTDRRPLDMLAATFGGNVVKHAPKGFGRKPQWVWEAYGRCAKQFLIAIAPHLIIKRKEAEMATRFPCGNGSRNCSIEERALRRQLRDWFVGLHRNKRVRVAV